MTTATLIRPIHGLIAQNPEPITYPDSDGEPMSDNTKQGRYILTIYGGFATLYVNDPNVFIAHNLLWYPIEGDNKTRIGPDVLLAFDRHKGDRGSYRQWEENNVPPQIVFEILSPGNRPGEMARKFVFYEDHGVEEYYIYDPDAGSLVCHIRKDDYLSFVKHNGTVVSPRTGVRLQLMGSELTLYYPNGQIFEPYEIVATRANAERERANAERERANAEHERANAERERAERLTAQLRALGIEPTA